MGRRNLGPDFTQRVIELEKDGVSPKDIAERLGCCVATVYNHLGRRTKAQEQRSEPETASVPTEN